MSPGDTTPSGQLTTVAAGAMVAQSQPTHDDDALRVDEHLAAAEDLARA
jgi:hypothetical protein